MSEAVREGASAPDGLSAVHTLRINEPSQVRRGERIALQTALWRLSSLKRVRACGRVKTGGRAALVGVRHSERGSGFAGLQSCGSVWACPRCSIKIGAVRAAEVGTIVLSAKAQGYSACFDTFTMRHHSGQRLAMLWDALTAGWRGVTNTKMWRADKQRFGVEGYVRVAAVTTGENGWHVHVHTLLITKPNMTNRECQSLGRSMWSRWNSGLESAGVIGTLPIGADFQLVSDGEAVSEYVAKCQNLGAELMIEQGKTARTKHSTLPVLSLLRDFLETGETWLLHRWHEYEQASHGRHQMSMSRGLRERFGVGPERTDEEIAAEEIGTEADTVCWITADGWDSLIGRPWLISGVLDSLDNGGWPALREYLLTHQIEYITQELPPCECGSEL